MNENNEKPVSNWIYLISTGVSICCLIFTGLMWYCAFKANQLTYEANQLSKTAIFESSVKAEEANRLAKEATDKTEKFAIINAEVQWDGIWDSYDKIDISLQEWEKSKNLKRKGEIIKSRNELEMELRQLDAPDYIKRLYLKRFDKYQIMENVAKQYKPFSQRMTHIDFTLPSAPRLPKRGNIKYSPHGGNIISK